MASIEGYSNRLSEEEYRRLAFADKTEQIEHLRGDDREEELAHCVRVLVNKEGEAREVYLSIPKLKSMVENPHEVGKKRINKIIKDLTKREGKGSDSAMESNAVTLREFLQLLPRENQNLGEGEP